MIGTTSGNRVSLPLSPSIPLRRRSIAVGMGQWQAGHGRDASIDGTSSCLDIRLFQSREEAKLGGSDDMQH